MGIVRDVAGAFIPGVGGEIMAADAARGKKRSGDLSSIGGQTEGPDEGSGEGNTAGGSEFGETFGRKVLRGVKRAMSSKRS